jgi:hypothetical protein
MRSPARLLLALCLAASLAGSSANAAGMHPEFALGAKGFLGLGEFATASKFGFGWDATLHLVREGGGLGLRAAGGLLLFQGRTAGTGEVIFNGIGTQEGSFIANQNFVWLAVGPEWSSPVGNGRIDYYLVLGKATVNATSSGTHFNVAGSDPGTTHTSLMLAGATWSMPRGRAELGAEVFASGSAALWDDPPITGDGAGNYVTAGRTASITGIAIRLAVHFGRGARRV